jgi:hypothetical protein
MERLTITDETAWQEGAPGRPPDDPMLLTRLLAAVASPRASPSKESITEALKGLLSLGFVVEIQQETPSPPTALAHYIAQTLLNFAVHHGTPSPFEFSLHLEQCSINIPTRSTLLLLHLSNILSINIFVFSSRATPKAFTYAGSTSCIALFHRVDSYHGTSEYCVIAPSIHIPNPDPPPLAVPPPTFTSPVHVATFREGTRKSQRSTVGMANFPSLEICKTALSRVW